MPRRRDNILPEVVGRILLFQDIDHWPHLMNMQYFKRQ
jgi:hypothetical protein